MWGNHHYVLNIQLCEAMGGVFSTKTFLSSYNFDKLRLLIVEINLLRG
ncbi:hypothetical protein HMPREF0650_0759 [Hoylesella buccalis ATCC 35310]|uniref:Uncharacterized protein n=1 Tax=Hoylesella buccalis ATCC 35310 TaxID=679190 RepID=D1W594_9BACT|nr:hypothetical protein HMPREF0650_0759 [Hoylesella buccalis ATCC 35310]